EPMGRADAVTALAGDTWATRLLDPRMRAEEFDTLCWMADRVPVRLVRAGEGADGIGQMRRMIREQVAGSEVRSRASYDAHVRHQRLRADARRSAPDGR